MWFHHLFRISSVRTFTRARARNNTALEGDCAPECRGVGAALTSVPIVCRALGRFAQDAFIQTEAKAIRVVDLLEQRADHAQ